LSAPGIGPGAKRENREKNMEQQKSEKSGGLGLGVGLDINLRLGEIQSVVGQLTDALQAAGGKVTDTVAGAIQKLREAAPQLKQAKEKEGGKGEASQTYDRMVAQLREASRRGEKEARDMLSQLGEKVEAGGEKMQEKAQPGPAR
jgi:hypothetical protein